MGKTKMHIIFSLHAKIILLFNQLFMLDLVNIDTNLLLYGDLCRLYRELFCEMFHGDPKLSVKSTFMDSMVILWQIWRIYCECFENNSSNFSLNFIHVFVISKNVHHGPPLFILFSKNIRQLWPFCLNSAKV